MDITLVVVDRDSFISKAPPFNSKYIIYFGGVSIRN